MYWGNGERRRFFALSFIGCLLLLVYQVVFMARTSAARDLNHIRTTRLTIQQAERFVLHNVSEARIAATIAAQSLNGEHREDVLVKRFPKARTRQLSHHVPASYVLSVIVDGYHLPIIEHSSIFRLAKAPQSLQLSLDNTLVMQYTDRVPVDHVVEYAVNNGFKAVIYVVPPTWLPRFGAREYTIPVAASLQPPPAGSKVTFKFNAGSDTAIEKTFYGHVSETVLVGHSGDSAQSLAVFVEMMSVLDALTARGWKPYRTIHFVSFPKYSAGAWAHDAQRWVRQHVVAYIDTSDCSSISASPLLNRTMNWALDTLRKGGLYSEMPEWLESINPPDGANVFQFDFQVPSVSAGLSDPVSTTRLLNLALASMASETVVPFAISEYAPYLNSREFNAEAAAFDDRVELLKFEFTHEYPWYQGMQKLRSIVQLKRANARLVGFEKQLANQAGHHVVFANNRAGTGTSISPVPEEVADAVTSLLESEFLLF